MYVCVNNRWNIRERQRHAVLWFCIMYYCMTITMYNFKKKKRRLVSFPCDICLKMGVWQSGSDSLWTGCGLGSGRIWVSRTQKLDGTASEDPNINLQNMSKISGVSPTFTAKKRQLNDDNHFRFRYDVWWNSGSFRENVGAPVTYK